MFKVDRAYVSMAHTAEVYGLLQVGAASLFSDIEHNNSTMAAGEFSILIFSPLLILRGA